MIKSPQSRFSSILNYVSVHVRVSLSLLSSLQKHTLVLVQIQDQMASPQHLVDYRSLGWNSNQQDSLDHWKESVGYTLHRAQTRGQNSQQRR